MLIEKVTRPTEELFRALQHLIPQLGAHKFPPRNEELAAMLASESCTLLIARDSNADVAIIGILCLNIYRVPTGVRSIIEDVVVDESARRMGIGEALMLRALDVARAAGASGVSLTSRPDREAANRLYQSMGFELRKTNAYHYKLK